jgi:hypothetical protein
LLLVEGVSDVSGLTVRDVSGCTPLVVPLARASGRSGLVPRRFWRGTLTIWDLETGAARATLQGHTGAVAACVVTPDGLCAVSVSWDRTLKVWDLDTYACLATHRGDTAYHAVAATTTVIVAGDTTGGVWVLDMPARGSLRRSEQHNLDPGASENMP